MKFCYQTFHVADTSHIKKFIVCVYVFMLYVPVNNCSVMLRSFPFFLDRTSTKQRIKCLAQGHNTVASVSPELETFRSQV